MRLSPSTGCWRIAERQTRRAIVAIAILFIYLFLFMYVCFLLFIFYIGVLSFGLSLLNDRGLMEQPTFTEMRKKGKKERHGAER